MHWVISGSFGPTDPTRAMLPFLFAASAVQAGDSVTLMLFHDAVLMAVDGVGKTLVPATAFAGPLARATSESGWSHAAFSSKAIPLSATFQASQHITLFCRRPPLPLPLPSREYFAGAGRI